MSVPKAPGGKPSCFVNLILLVGLLGLLSAVGGGIYWFVIKDKNNGGTSEKGEALPTELAASIDKVKASVGDLEEDYSNAKSALASSLKAGQEEIEAWAAATQQPGDQVPLETLQTALDKLKKDPPALEFPDWLKGEGDNLTKALDKAAAESNPMASKSKIEKLRDTLKTNVGTLLQKLARAEDAGKAIDSAVAQAKKIREASTVAVAGAPPSWFTTNSANIRTLDERAKTAQSELATLVAEFALLKTQPDELKSAKAECEQAIGKLKTARETLDKAAPEAAETAYNELESVLTQFAGTRQKADSSLHAALSAQPVKNLSIQSKEKLEANKLDVANRIELAKANSSVDPKELTAAVEALYSDDLVGMWMLGRVYFGYAEKAISNAEFTKLAAELARDHVRDVMGKKGQAKVVYVGFASRDIGKTKDDQERLDRTNVRFSHDRAEALKRAVAQHVASDERMSPAVKKFFSTDDRETIRAVGVGAAEMFSNEGAGAGPKDRNQCAELWLAVFRQ